MDDSAEDFDAAEDEEEAAAKQRWKLVDALKRKKAAMHLS